MVSKRIDVVLLDCHVGHFASVQDNWGFDSRVDFPLSWGVAMFTRKDLEVRDTGSLFVVGYFNSKKEDKDPVARNLQYATIRRDGKNYTIAHFHGLWNGKGKGDCSERIDQSLRVRESLDSLEGKKILCGDFNLDIDTQSLTILEKGNVNLIKEYGIESTRSHLKA